MSDKSDSNHGPLTAPSRAGFEPQLEFDFLDFASFVYSHRKFLILFSSAAFILAGVWTFVINRPVFKAHATVNVNFSSKQQTVSFGKFTNWVEEQEMQNKVYLTEQFFNSSKFRTAFLDEVEGRTNHCKQKRVCGAYRRLIQNRILKPAGKYREDRISAAFNHLDIFTDSNKYILTIQGSAGDPNLALALTDLAAVALVELNYELLLERNSRVKKFLEEQTEEIRHQLEDQELAMVDLQRKFNVMLTADSPTRLASPYLELKNKLNELQRQELSYRTLESELEHDLRDLRAEIASPQKSSYLYLTQVQKRIDFLRYQEAINRMENRQPAGATSEREMTVYRDLIGKSKDGLIATDPWEQIRKLEGLLIEARQNRDKVTSELEATKGVMGQLARDYERLPESFRQLSDMQRNIDTSNSLYGILKQRLQETRIQEAERANDLSILAMAERPSAPSGMTPGRKIIVAGGAGPALAILILFLFYVLAPTVRDARDLERLGIRVIGRFLSFRPKNRSLMRADPHPLILAEEPKSYSANSVRYTRFKLEEILGLRRASDHMCQKVLSLVSTQSGEGKTFMAANLGMGFAAADYKVLLIDLDVDKPDLKPYFRNLTPVADEIVSPLDYLTSNRYNVSRNLDLLTLDFTSGFFPLHFLESLNFKNFLDIMKADYDLIIIDSPPIDGHLEPFILAREADACLFVVNQRSALRGDTKQALQSLRETMHQPILAILNFSYEGVRFLKKRKAAKIA